MGRHRPEPVMPAGIWSELRTRLPAPSMSGEPPGPSSLGRQLYRIETTAGPILVKEQGFLTADRAAVFAAALDLLVEGGLHPPTPAFADGHRLASIKGRFFTCLTLLDARPYEAVRDLEAAAETIARMHGLLAKIQEPPTHSPMWAEAGQVMAELARLGRLDLAGYVEEADAVKAEVPFQVVHNDLHSGNLLRVGGAVLVTDLESLSTNPLPGDVFFAALRLGETLPGCRRFLDVYRASAAATLGALDLGPMFLLADLARKFAFIHRRRALGDCRYEKDIGKYHGLIERAVVLRQALAPAGSES